MTERAMGYAGQDRAADDAARAPRAGRSDVDSLLARLEEAEETLRAIRTGEVDALVVQGPDGPRTYTLVTADQSYRILVEQMSEGALTLGADGLIVYCNTRLATMLGIPRATAAGRRLVDLVHADDQAALTELLRTAGAGVATGEVRLRATNGDDVPVHLSLGAFRSGPFDGICGLVSDLTERKRREERERLLEAERHARSRLTELLSVAGALSAAISPVAVARTVVDSGRRALSADSCGLALVTDDGRQIELFCCAGPAPAPFDTTERVPVESACAAGIAVATRRVVTFGSAAERAAAIGAGAVAVDTCEAAVAAPLLAGDRVLGSLVAVAMAEREWADDEVALLTAFADQCAQALERARLYEAEQRARSEAEASNRAKSEFLAVMSHELRTPLNAIGGHLELIEMGLHGPLTQPQREAIERVQRNQRHLLGLIGHVLDFARVEAGRVEYVLTDVDLADVVGSLRPLIGPQLAARGIAYDVALPDPPPVVRADREKLEQILVNLLANAVKFTDPGGRVAVSIATRVGVPGTVFLRVSDTGRGIPPEKASAIFEPFVRVKTGLTSAEGVGLGLAIARDLARGMGGDLRVRSEVGKGSTFTVSLAASGHRDSGLGTRHPAATPL